MRYFDAQFLQGTKKIMLKVQLFIIRYIVRIINTISFLLFYWQFFLGSYSSRLSCDYKHSFVFSLTTSPLRLKKLHYVFDNLPLNVPIVLNLPQKFKNVDSYDEDFIASLVAKYSNLIINRIKEDLGPQTKLLGLCFGSKDLIAFLQNKNIIIIDDDTKYPNTIVKTYDKYYTENDFLKEPSGKPHAKIYSAKLVIYNMIPIHQGFSSYSLNFNLLTSDVVQRCLDYSKLKWCKLHDDFSFSAAFQDHGFKIIKVFGIPNKQFLYGYDTDALHFQEPNVIKSDKCSTSIWQERQECPNYTYNYFDL